MRRWSKKLSAPLIEFVGRADGEKILDPGCRTGSLSRATAGSADVRSVTGIDPSET